MKHLLAAATCLLLAAPGAQAQSTPSGARAPDCVATQGPLPEKWEGTAFAIDGDTLAGVGLKPHIRIWGIQAPELRDKDKQETVPGMRARAALDNWLFGGNYRITCTPTKFDRYCRIVAHCLVKTIDLGDAMLNAGMAYGFYLDDVIPGRPQLSESYARSENMARNKKIGLWKDWLGEK